MNLEKAKNEDKLSLCRKYFLGGFAFLPFLWFVNFVWFFKYAFLAPHFNEQSAIRKYVTWSGIGSLIWTIIIVMWIIVFQTQRVKWGATGDYMSFVWPRGYA